LKLEHAVIPNETAIAIAGAIRTNSSFLVSQKSDADTNPAESTRTEFAAALAREVPGLLRQTRLNSLDRHLLGCARTPQEKAAFTAAPRVAEIGSAWPRYPHGHGAGDDTEVIELLAIQGRQIQLNTNIGLRRIEHCRHAGFTQAGEGGAGQCT
jgi:hypothetical protein